MNQPFGIIGVLHPYDVMEVGVLLEVEAGGREL